MDVLTVKIEAEEMSRIVSEAIEKVKADKDLVKAIRCRDCVHCWPYTDHSGDCDFWKDEVELNGFCSYGERKDTE